MLLRPDSYKKGVVKSTFFNILAKGLGFVNSLIIIYLFGSGAKTDLYFVILSTGIVITSFVNSIDSLVIIPESMRLRENKGQQAERNFLNFFIRLYLGIGILLLMIVFFFPDFFYSLFSKYDRSFLESEQMLLRLSALLPPIQLITNFFISIMASYRYFTTPMIVGLINSTISIITLLIIRDTYSTVGALAALVVGNLINLIWIVRHFHKNMGWRFFSGSSIPPRRVVHNIGMMQLNVLPITIRSLSTVYFVSGLGAGIITSLNYGQQLALIPELLVVTQILAVVGIKFNELSSKQDKEGLNNFFQQIQSLLIFIAMPVGIFMALTGGEIVKVLFSYSKKFDQESAKSMALVISFIALTLPARALDLCMTKLVMSQQKIKQGVAYGVLTHVFITILVIAGVVAGGLKGYLIATVVGYYVILPAIYYFLLKRIAPFIDYTHWLTRSVPFVLTNAALFIGIYFFKTEFLHNLPALVVLGITGVLYAGILLIVNAGFLKYVPATEMLGKLIFKK